MCGITALFAYRDDAAPIARAEVEAINARMIPRGPDAGGIWISPDERVALGARRLAIIDLSPEGVQPLKALDSDRRIVFNGEIYNHRELRARLEQRGAQFHSHSDTEVILQLYAHYGERCVDLLRGMFAFAIWDAPERRLFVARGAYGIKPLYFADDGRTFRCASTVKALLAGGAIPNTRDDAAVAGFLMLGSVPEPFTLNASIRALGAGRAFFVDASGRHGANVGYSLPKIFRRAVDQKSIANLTTPETALREFVTESIDHHLVSDVPVGLFLSAGIDSATIAALAAARSREPLRTITIVFDAFRNSQFDEAAAAEAFAQERNAPHTTRVVTREEFLADLPKIFDAMDQPTIDGVNTWFVSKAAAEQKLKVALSGVGGDELFGSYPSFTAVPKMVRAVRGASRVPLGKFFLARALRFRSRNPKTAAIPELGATFAGSYLAKRGLFMPAELPGMFSEEALARLDILNLIGRALEPDPLTDFGRVASLEASLYMRNQLLRDTDWASMAHSLEVRTPLVDLWLTRQLAPLLLAKGAACKQYFAAAPARPLPPFISRRPKTGFQTPLGAWLDLPPDGTTTRMRSWARVVLERFE
jgi:asparagine synthase (glutamine-hydrolysing)